MSILLSWHNHLYIDSSDKKDSLDSHYITLIGKKFEFHLEINSDDMADQFAKALVFILKGGNKVIRSELKIYLK